jgi:hypothetical protein
MTNALGYPFLTADAVRAETIAAASPALKKTADPSFADTFARCATPLFSPWPLTAPAREEALRTSDRTITTRAADQRRDRRQRSRE